MELESKTECIMIMIIIGRTRILKRRALNFNANLNFR